MRKLLFVAFGLTLLLAVLDGDIPHTVHTRAFSYSGFAAVPGGTMLVSGTVRSTGPRRALADALRAYAMVPDVIAALRLVPAMTNAYPIKPFWEYPPRNDGGRIPL